MGYLDISFIKASNALFNADLIKTFMQITDVTNGGLRGMLMKFLSVTGRFRILS